MINSNPETVSTDYDTSDKLYFEPLTREDVLNIIELEQPDGVIVQFGGQTPLNLAVPLEKAGVKIIGTQPDAIDRAEDRKRFQKFLQKLNLRQPDNDTVNTLDEALTAARRIGYPVVVRPSYVLGGRDMRIVYNDQGIRDFMIAIGGTIAGAPDPHRQVPERCHRGRCRRHLRRQTHHHRRHHGAYRGGRHPLGRLGLRPAAPYPLRRP